MLSESVPALVSVIMPTYNCAAYIRQAIDSVLGQRDASLELIVVDDGSTDDTAAILASYGDRLRVLRQANGGVAAARNAGLRAARGEFVGFLDADDLWLPWKLAVQLQHLRRHPDVGVVYAAWQVWRSQRDGSFGTPPTCQAPPDDGVVPLEEAGSGWLYNRLLEDCIIHTSAVLLRRSLLARVGLFDEALRRGEDYDLWLRLSRETRIDKLACCVSVYRFHTASVTNRPDMINYGADVIARAVSRWGYVGPDGTRTRRAVMRAVLWKLWFDFGYQHYRHGNAAVARHSFRQSLRQRPLHVRSWIYLALAARQAGESRS